MSQIGVRNVSVERALRWVQQFARTEWSLILPVALAFFGLPRLGVMMLMNRQLPVVPQTLAGMQALGNAMPRWWGFVLIAMLLLAFAGALTLMAMSLRPRISVGEAILEAARRLPIALAVGVIVAAALFLLLFVGMTVVAVAGGGEAAAFALVFISMAVTLLTMLMLLPVVLIHHIGPIGAIAAGWRIYSGSIFRIVGGLLLFALGAALVSLAVQKAIGSMLIIGAQLLGQKQTGEDLTELLVSLVVAIGWSGFSLLIAAFYRQRVGLD